jgi:hypothetical protein
VGSVVTRGSCNGVNESKKYFNVMVEWGQLHKGQL